MTYPYNLPSTISALSLAKVESVTRQSILKYILNGRVIMPWRFRTFDPYTGVTFLTWHRVIYDHAIANINCPRNEHCHRWFHHVNRWPKYHRTDSSDFSGRRKLARAGSENFQKRFGFLSRAPSLFMIERSGKFAGKSRLSVSKKPCRGKRGWKTSKGWNDGVSDRKNYLWNSPIIGYRRCAIFPLK